MKVGDLIKCGNEITVIVDTVWTTSEDQHLWLECYWPETNEFEGIPVDEAELLSESR